MARNHRNPLGHYPLSCDREAQGYVAAGIGDNLTGHFWTTEQLADLRDKWINRRADITARDFAKEYAVITGRTPDAIRFKLTSLREYKIPSSNRTPWNNPPVLEGDAFVLMDAQIPYHHAEFINKCLTLCEKWNIRQMILGGDALDMNAMNTFAPNFENDDKRVIDTKTASTLLAIADTLPSDKREEIHAIVADAEGEGGISGEIKESRAVLKSFESSFDTILWIMGNHEQRVLRALQKVLPVDSLAVVFGADNPRWTVSPYYKCVLNSGGELWRIEHPVNTGKGSSKKLASKFTSHVIMGHNHHFNITTDPSGKWYAIEPGMGMDEERMAYVSQRSNSADTHMTGAVIIRNGKPTALNKFTDWDMLK